MTTADRVRDTLLDPTTLAFSLQRGYIIKRDVGRAPIEAPERIWNTTAQAGFLISITVQYADGSILACRVNV